MLSLIVRGGTVVDGSGAPPFPGDVAVRDGRIEAIGNLPDAVAETVLDATGLVVAPGFIDIHSHSDFTLLVDPRAQSAIAQGVTTELVGNCGHGCAPASDPALVAWNVYGYSPDVQIDWTTMAGYLERLDTTRPAVNVASLVPNGNLRLAVLGRADRPATAEERTAMARLLEQGLEEGAFGLSTGLESPLEREVGEEEIVALCRVVAGRDALYATHTRNKETLAAEAVEEATRTAETSGARLQVSHIIPRRGGAPADALERSLAAIDGASERGVDAAFDIHTRLFGFTNLSAALPVWVAEGDDEAVAARLRDPTARAAMKRQKTLISSFELGGWDRVVLLDTPHRPDAEGRSLAELTPAGGDPYDVIFDVLLDERDEIHRPTVMCWSYDEDQLASAFGHERCMVGSDATTLSLGGPLANSVFHGAYTWASWLHRRFVRELRLVSTEEMVHRLAAVPAEHIGLKGRGVLRPGNWADIAVFDRERFRETGSVSQPNQLAEGMVHVVVNGQIALRDGAFTGCRSGTVLRRGGSGQ